MLIFMFICGFLVGLLIGAYTAPRPVLDSIRIKIYMISITSVILIFLLWQSIASHFFDSNTMANEVLLTALTALATGWCFYRLQGISKSESEAKIIVSDRSITLTKMFSDLAIPRALGLTAKRLLIKKEAESPNFKNAEIKSFFDAIFPLIQSSQRIRVELDSVVFPRDMFKFYSIWRMAVYSYNDFLDTRDQYEEN